MKALLACLGAALIVFAMVVGLSPHSVERVAEPSLSCGSPWRPATGATAGPDGVATDILGVYPDAAARCDAESGVLGSLAGFVAAGGVLLVVGAGLAAALRRGPGRRARRAGAGIPEPRTAGAEPAELSPYDATPVTREPIA